MCEVIVMHYMYDGLHVLTDNIIQFMQNVMHISLSMIVLNSRHR